MDVRHLRALCELNLPLPDCAEVVDSLLVPKRQHVHALAELHASSLKLPLADLGPVRGMRQRVGKEG